MEASKHNPGTFCWVELGTTDQPAAKKFYTELFGWQVNDFPMGPDSFYTMLQIDGKDVAALYQQDKQQIEHGVPPHWMLYISVESADETVKSIKAAGGQVLMDPFDVFEFGRMALVQDPTGAHFALWQPRTHIGVRLHNQSNTLCWHELATRDTGAAKSFYTKVFGWRADSKSFGPMTYTELFLNDQAVGGMMDLVPEMGNVPPHWLAYFAVDDCDAVAKKAKSLGGGTIVPPQDIPNVGRFSVIQDPQGAVFAIIKLDHKNM